MLLRVREVRDPLIIVLGELDQEEGSFSKRERWRCVRLGTPDPIDIAGNSREVMEERSQSYSSVGNGWRIALMSSVSRAGNPYISRHPGVGLQLDIWLNAFHKHSGCPRQAV